MVPLRLYLRNFMSYGDQGEELDFAFHVGCLSGNNGDGKSALLDAITWALFGIARGLSAGGAGADDLIRSAPGVDEAVVELDFRIGDHTYRVRRSRHRKRGGSLELAAWDGEEYRRLTSMTKRDTQQLLLDLLRMDYETFVSSSFLLQGQADRFTMQTPTERKRILAQILGLGRYDVLEERAREHARTAKAAAKQHEELVARLDEQVAQADECRLQLEQCAAAGEAAQAELAELQEKQRQAQGRVNDLLQKQERRRQLEMQYAGLMTDRERLTEQAGPLQKRLQAKRALIAGREQVERGYAALQQARAEDQQYAQKLAAYSKLAEEQQRLLREVELARHTLQSQIGHERERLADLEMRAALADPLAEKVARLQQQQARLVGIGDRLEELRVERGQAATEVEVLSRSNQELGRLVKELQQRLELLYQAEAKCPLCESELTEEKRLALVSQMREQGAETSQTLQSQAAQLEQAQARIGLLDSEQADLKAQLADMDELQKSLGELLHQLEQAKQAAEELAEVKARVESLQAELAAGQYASEMRAALQHCKEQIEQLGYDAERHRQASLEAGRLAGFERQKVELEAALRSVDEDTAALEALETTDREKSAAAETCLQQGRALEVELRQLPEAQAALAQTDQALAMLAERQRHLAQEYARWQERWERCQEAKQERDQRLADKKQADKDAVIYAELATAFSKRGIQAIIIENVIPQLVEDANELLARLTAGQMQVSLTTRALTGKGELAETLEIMLSDQLGTRRYELYSGGEAFRANFAVRIALSRLLAQRAGAKLQTLVLDEGFGTQDTLGRERLVEAIHTVAGDFERILVITHIEDLKEAFDYRIEVTKDEKGSHLAVAG